ncbi:MAG: LysM peptidoglycan-binding domain-containing protein, partial [Bacteroidia bacterium]|nr:LysM peptidoglycan-binding domain-containing protein [Bacteroidia bacterium]
KGVSNSQDILAMQEVMKIHTVRRGEHLHTIANRYKCTIYDLKLWNNLKSNYIKPGQHLTVYVNKISGNDNPVVKQENLTHEVKTETQAAKNNDATHASENKYYTIVKGDTLWDISRKTGKSIAEIKRLNNIGNHYVLLPGHKIKIG